MRKGKTSAFSGCLIWILLIILIGSCVLPVFMVMGSVSSFSDFAIGITGEWLCPEQTTPNSHSYPTTTMGENGVERPSTAYELHCVDSAGTVVKKDPILYAFVWIGISAGIGAVVTALLAFVFAVPGGMLVSKFLEKLKSSGTKTVDRT